ncbi:MAG: TIGR02206 family membrane protein [Candidatus Marinimicrobia bacterium]|nr:TIGR02206 family membrane protein [Candidatus Neomarinimicrobiota bacterium]
MADGTIPMFVQFGPAHRVAMGAVVAAWIVIPLLARRLSAGGRRRIDRALALTLVGTEVVQQFIWIVVLERWSLNFSLPLHLCGLSIFILSAALWTHNARLFQVGYFWGVASAINSILTPELFAGWPSWQFSAFFFFHAMLMLAPLHLVATTPLRPTLSGLHQTFGLTLGVTAVIGGINLALGSNYMFLCRPPMGDNIISLYLSPWPWYIPQLALIALLNFYVVYLPFAIADYRRHKTTVKEAI